MYSLMAGVVGPGIYYGYIDTTGSSGQDNITTDAKLMQYPTDENDRNIVHPKTIVLTEFHVLVLFPDR